jgi:PAS domain S-box-containing protein
MRVRSKLAVHLLEACEAVGIAREDVTSAISADSAASLAEPLGTIEWDVLAALFDRVWAIVDGDVDRMRDVGRAVVHAPSYAILRRIARTVVSVESIYEAGARWVAPAAVPHLPLEQTILSGSRLRAVVTIPTPYAPCIGIFHFFEGVLIEIPHLLGLERSKILTSNATPRQLEVIIEMPRSPSLLRRIRRGFRVATGSIDEHDVHDILEGQRAELAEGLQEVRRSTSEIQEVFDHLPVLVIIHREGTILWKNRAVVTTLGYQNCDDLVGRSLFELIDPSLRDRVEQRMRLAPNDMPLTEGSLLRRDGQSVAVEVFPTQLVMFDGKPARMIVGQDITERVRLQQQLLVSARMASIGMLAAGVAHEVNNPLAYVLNNVEIARKQLAPLGEDARQGREALGIALEGVDRIRTIVRDLLALARVDDASVGPVDLLAVVESTLALARNEIAARAELAYEHEPVPLASGTTARIGQVLLNLLTNALEALPVESRGTNRLRVVVRPSATGGTVIEVSDNGVGISADHAPHIFDPFFTTKAPGSGTGLGLAISQRLVAEMGGELSFESVVKRGSTFRVTLPAADLDDRAHQPESASL